MLLLYIDFLRICEQRPEINRFVVCRGEDTMALSYILERLFGLQPGYLAQQQEARLRAILGSTYELPVDPQREAERRRKAEERDKLKGMLKEVRHGLATDHLHRVTKERMDHEESARIFNYDWEKMQSLLAAKFGKEEVRELVYRQFGFNDRL